MTTITNPDRDTMRMIVLKSRLSMEVAGMKCRGRSAYAMVKEEYGFKGSKQKVYNQLVALVERTLPPKEELK